MTSAITFLNLLVIWKKSVTEWLALIHNSKQLYVTHRFKNLRTLCNINAFLKWPSAKISELFLHRNGKKGTETSISHKTNVLTKDMDKITTNQSKHSVSQQLDDLMCKLNNTALQ